MLLPANIKIKSFIRKYWATLGRVVEHTGLTVQEAQTRLKGMRQRRVAQQTRTVADLSSRLLAAEASGSLAQRVCEVVEENRKQAK